MKPTTTRAALLVVAALSLLLTGLFVATASRSDAQAAACPTGFELTADASACFQRATTVTGAPTCTAGTLTPDATACYVDAQVLNTAGATTCPDGFSIDDSLNGACARFTPATQGPPTCPDGARGTAGGCYVLVAKGDPNLTGCSAEDVALGAVLAGGLCVITGPAPIASPGVCPTSATVLFEAGTCFQLISPASTNPTVCTAAADIGLVDGQCRQSVVLTPGGPRCPDGFAHVAGKCVRYTNPISSGPICPAGATEDTTGQCRRPVADQAGAYSCPTGGTLNGRSCVTTTGFLVNAAPALYSCNAGERTVVGSGTSVRVLCVLGPPTVAAGVQCTRGVIDTTGEFCVVPVLETATAGGASAPIPGFTG